MIGWIAVGALYLSGCGLAVLFLDDQLDLRRLYWERAALCIVVWPLLGAATLGYLAWKFGLARLLNWAGGR